MSLGLTYLTCTAAQAEEFNTAHPHDIHSLNQLLEHHASLHPGIVVAGFPERGSPDAPWRTLSLTYKTLFAACNAAANYYIEQDALTPRTSVHQGDRIIALLSPSCADFLVTLFAGLRLGYGLLLLAPQNTPQAIRHLCDVVACTHLICHSTLRDHAQGALAGSKVTVRIVDMVPRSVWLAKSVERIVPLFISPGEERDLTALVMHTSGSTGIPKPVYHPHRIWTEAIPCMPGEPAFTTTPLYHGGSADLLRSMGALSTLYLFSSTYPVTVSNVIGAVSACPNVTAFLSVPYILKLLAEDTDGLQLLLSMDLVSTGGAPLSEALGDAMVRSGVILVNRLGSSECGFLMSSHRHYETDQGWSWLRNNEQGETRLVFELVADSENMYELVVPKAWSTRVVSNREDGSFATGDLYAKHPTIRNAWQYSGRIDDIIVMINGKKASANPIETALRASPDIAEAVVFGASRPALGVLVVPALRSTTEKQIMARIHDINRGSPPYAQIGEALVVILPYDATLPKTSKGSVVRPRALIQFAELIDGAYDCFETGSVELNGSHEYSTEDEIRQYVRHIIFERLLTKKGLGFSMKDDDDLFGLGVDSLQAIVIRNALQIVVSPFGARLGGNAVFEYPSIDRLVMHILDVRAGRSLRPGGNDEGQWHRMRDLVEEYGSFHCQYAECKSESINANDPNIIVLTGATGALGAHLLALLVQMTEHFDILALVRAKDNAVAKVRIQESLSSRKLPPIDIEEGFTSRSSHVHAFAADLVKEDLGLGAEVYEELLARASLIFHVAWPVNFVYGLDSFVPILRGTRNLIALTARTGRGASFVFCSSTAAVINEVPSGKDCSIQEDLPRSESSSLPMGYARAKWVAEHICAHAHDGPLRGRITIARVGQLCGDTVHGIWNESEALPLLIASSRCTGCLPDLAEHPSWLPMDIAARVLSELGFAKSDVRDRIPVYHVVNPNRVVSWGNIIRFLACSGLTFHCVSPEEWMRRLKACEENLHPATRNLLGIWEEKYCVSGDTLPKSEPVFNTMLAAKASITMRLTPPVTEDLIHKFCQSWYACGFLPGPVSP